MFLCHRQSSRGWHGHDHRRGQQVSEALREVDAVHVGRCVGNPRLQMAASSGSFPFLCGHWAREVGDGLLHEDIAIDKTAQIYNLCLSRHVTHEFARAKCRGVLANFQNFLRPTPHQPATPSNSHQTTALSGSSGCGISHMPWAAFTWLARELRQSQRNLLMFSRCTRWCSDSRPAPSHNLPFL